MATPNIGVQGSRGASAVPLLATMIAWGREGISDCIDHGMSMARKLANELSKEDSICVWAMPQTGVVVFRPLTMTIEEFHQSLPEGMFSSCVLDGKKWIRSVAANPLADIDKIIAAVREVVR